MSGHSRWSQIKRQKASTDQKRGQLFSKLSRLITLASKKGSDPKLNQTLRNAIDKAHQLNMSSANIERAIERASDKSTSSLEEILIDIIGPEGVAMRIKAITDNKNRTMAEIKQIIAEYDFKLTPPGNANWMFSRTIEISPENTIRTNTLRKILGDHEAIEDIRINT